ncbi:DUF1804 family protein [Campylobacter fetus]|uniref:DUF1804 family protein n=1 Tax=Campylobacter fetus TaxID=196 RepID=UPI000CFBED43|nr:DUF1804 family protein [Campylobacter fetus]AVK80646.1 hypothetical protein C6B32_01945 [Campylobacter fetus subsp. testudinum]
MVRIKKQTCELAHELYIKGFSIAKIAEILGKTEKTIKNYKSASGEWDVTKATRLIAEARSDGNNIYQNFIEQMYAAVREIRESDLKAGEKAVALSKVGDSFSKMKKIASFEDPASYKLAIAKKVVTIVVSHFQSKAEKECLNELLKLVETDKFIKAIEELE